jgi:PAS domain S-box-containing protein
VTCAFYWRGRYLWRPSARASESLAKVGIAVTMATVYFLAARVGLVLLSQPSDVAVFWPASGIAAGILINSERRAYPALVIGVVVGTVAANIMSDRSVLTALLKGFCSAGEAVLAAWLLERWVARPFRFANLRRLAGFLAAAVLATAASATGGAATMTLLHSAAPYWDVWRTWFLSDWVGIVVIAPLVIGLREIWDEPPSLREWTEGIGVLALAVLASFYTVSHESGSWLSFSPGAIVLPVLLWLTARCPAAFGMAGAFIASVAVILATTCGVGRFGDAGVPLMERAKGAQVATITVTLYTLILIALFTQRKETEKELRESEGQLAKKSTALARLHEIGSRLWLKRDLGQALDDILTGAIELLGADMGNIQVKDATRGVLKIAAHRGFNSDFLDLFKEVSADGASACGRALRSGEQIVIADVETDALFTPFRPAARAAGFRGVQSTPIRGREGTLLGVLSTHFRSVNKPAAQDLHLLDLYVRQAADIIQRHRAEDALRESEERLRLAQLRTGIGVWDRNLRTGKLTLTPELEDVFGHKPGSVKSYTDFRVRVHPDDIAAFEAERDAAVRRRETFKIEYRIIRPDGQVRWMLARGGAFYDEVTGEPIRLVGNDADITERKQAELALADRDTQLALAGKIGRVGSFAFDFGSRRIQVSPGYSAIHDLPESTSETNLADWRARVHPDDVGRLELQVEEAIAARRCEYSFEYRIFRRSGEVRWIESRASISYDNIDGTPKRAAGVDIDVTERKWAEGRLAERNAQLDLASKIAGVGTFVIGYETGVIRLSSGYATLLGLPDGTLELSRDDAGMLVHPEDRSRLEAQRNQVFLERRRELVAEFRAVRRDNGEVRWVETRSIVLYEKDGRPRRMIGVSIDVTERKRAEDHKTLLISELDHRVKNTLAGVAAIVEQTRTSSNSMDGFLELLRGRIRSLANTHALLSHNRWRGIAIGELVRGELAPCMRDGNTLIEGPTIFLTADAVQAVAIVLHELTTNAAKYGALSNAAGRVSVRWNWCSKDSVVLEWRETGGPDVPATAKPGYGTGVIRDLIPYELGGSVDYALDGSGARCNLEIPDKWFTSGTRWLDA